MGFLEKPNGFIENTRNHFKRIPDLKKRLFFIWTLLLSGLFLGPYAFCVSAQNPEAYLQAKYRDFLAYQKSHKATIPLQVFSETTSGVREARIFAILHQDFSSLSKILSSPANWCEIFPVVLNIKACTCQIKKGGPQLTFYVGRKFYQPAEKAFKLQYDFLLRALQKDYFDIALVAEKGPFGTSNYLLEVEGIKVPEGTFISVLTSYRASTFSRMATRGYLATLGRDKIGFTIVGGDKEHPEYVRGVRGVVERNAVRYYLALQAYMETRHLPPDKRFAAAADLWFDLTERFHKQLYEMNKAEYLEIKRREHLQQLRLQNQAKNPGREDPGSPSLFSRSVIN
jgi:hypothetical protein